MRVLLICGRYPPQACGIGDYASRLAAELERDGAEIAVLTSRLPRAVGLDPAGERSHVNRAMDRWSWTERRRLLDAVDAARPDIVHIQYQPTAFGSHPLITTLPPALRLTRARPSVVVTLHEMTGPRHTLLPSPLARAWLAPLVFGSDAVIVSNERDVRALRRVPALAGRLHLIPLAAAIERSVVTAAERRERRQRLGVADDETLVVRFGFVHDLHVNGIPWLLESLARIAADGRAVHLLLIGGADEAARAAVLEIAGRLGLADRVRVSGFVPVSEVTQYLSCADVAVQLYPRGVCERQSSLHAVMGHALPVVSTERGPTPSLFRNGENVLLVAPQDRGALAAALGRLASDGVLRARIGRAAAETVKPFTWSLVRLRTSDLYARLRRRARRAA